MRFLYTTLTYLLLPLVLLYLWLKSFKQPAYRHHFAQRLGLSGPAAHGPLLWVHSASLGEITAATPLIRQLLVRYPEHRVLLTTVTPTGAAQVREAFGGAVLHCYLPLDVGFAVRGFLSRYEPQLAVMMETEIWPTLYRELEARATPLVIVSARLSQRSFEGYGRFRSLIEAALGGTVFVGAQTDVDAERFASLGAAQARLQVTGNVKYAIDVPAGAVEQGHAFRQRHGALTRPVWVAASTHDGEEEQLIAAHKGLLTKFPTALLLLVPRHPERFDEVAKLLRHSGLSSVRRSSNQICDATCQVLLGDSMGEMMMYYAAADVAFVGGSLVNVGGHNLLEPAALGKPLLSGPAVQNAPDVAAMLVSGGGLQLVANSEALAGLLDKLFTRPGSSEAMGQLALQAMNKNRGALGKTLQLVETALRRS